MKCEYCGQGLKRKGRHQAFDPKAKSNSAKPLVFGPVPTVVDGLLKPAKAVVGRSGTPLTVGGKIVRMEKKARRG